MTKGVGSLLLNRKRELYFCEDPALGQPVWLPLSAGIIERKMSRNSEKLLFYELGREDAPKEELLSSVKLIALRGHVDVDDENLLRILKMNGKTVGIIQRDLSKNCDNRAIYCEATVEVLDDGSGLAGEPQCFEICLHCGHETEEDLSIGVNGVTFTQD